MIQTSEIESNEFNLNLSRYIETRNPDEFIPLEDALEEFQNESIDMGTLQKEVFARLQWARRS